jgi:hypothetical protein
MQAFLRTDLDTGITAYAAQTIYRPLLRLFRNGYRLGRALKLAYAAEYAKFYLNAYRAAAAAAIVPPARRISSGSGFFK